MHLTIFKYNGYHGSFNHIDFAKSILELRRIKICCMRRVFSCKIPHLIAINKRETGFEFFNFENFLFPAVLFEGQLSTRKDRLAFPAKSLLKLPLEVLFIDTNSQFLVYSKALCLHFI